MTAHVIGWEWGSSARGAWPGRLAIEVHDNDPAFGEARSGEGARSRWCNVRIGEIAATDQTS